MLIELGEPHPDGYSFAVYDPPAAGLPWLALYLGPGRRIIEVEPFATKAEADSAVERFVKDFRTAMRLGEPSLH